MLASGAGGPFPRGRIVALRRHDATESECRRHASFRDRTIRRCDVNPLPVSRREFHKLFALGVAAAAIPSSPVEGRAGDPNEPIRLHFNENPAGLAPGARRALERNLVEYAWQYPDDPRRELHSDLARFHGIDDDRLILGNGSSEILALSAQTFGTGGTIVIASPTYDAVAQYAGGVGAKVSRFPLGKDYTHDLDAMVDGVGGRGLLYICNPNNPTGTITPKGRVRAAIEAVPDDVVVVVDEAYHHYVTSDDYESCIPLTGSHPNLLVLRTFSKIYAMAGLRCGYGVADPTLISRLKARQARLNMNLAALLAAKASLADSAWVEESKKRNGAVRAMLFERLRSLGYEVTPSEASFFMVALGRNSRAVASEFAGRGILVGRPFPPMDDYLRVSIGTEPQMKRFLEVFEEVMG